MAYKRLPAAEFLKPAWHTVSFQGVPLFRAHAMALDDYLRHGGHLTVNSADRRKGVAERFGKLSQAALYDGWVHRRPGFLPANRPGTSSHELRSDGNPVYRVPSGHAIPDYMLGIDAVDHVGGDAARVVAWLNAHGYHAVRPYGSASERHHFVFTRSPVVNARARRAVKPKPKAKTATVKGVDAAGVRFIAQEEGFIGHPYNDPVGHATIGYGHLLHLGPVTDDDRRKWGTMTKGQALELLLEDVQAYSAAVRSVAPWLNQNQHNAITSAVFNLGTEYLSLKHTLGVALRARKGVPAALRLYVKGGTPLQTLPGLKARRAAEAALWSS